jgi:hypothetical protein
MNQQCRGFWHLLLRREWPLTRLAVRTRAPELTNADLSINPLARARTGTAWFVGWRRTLPERERARATGGDRRRNVHRNRHRRRRRRPPDVDSAQADVRPRSRPSASTGVDLNRSPGRCVHGQQRRGRAARSPDRCSKSGRGSSSRRPRRSSSGCSTWRASVNCWASSRHGADASASPRGTAEEPVGRLVLRTCELEPQLVQRDVMRVLERAATVNVRIVWSPKRKCGRTASVAPGLQLAQSQRQRHYEYDPSRVWIASSESVRGRRAMTSCARQRISGSACRAWAAKANSPMGDRMTRAQ